MWDRSLTVEYGRPAISPSNEARPIVILVVEDELIVRMSATDILQDAGFHVVEARDGVEAIAILDIRDDVAALFTDVCMPTINGVELAKIVSERWPDVGIVISSGAMPLGVELGLPTGAHFVQKPYLPNKLLKAIEAVLQRGSGRVAIQSIPTMQAGRLHGDGGLAQPLAEPEE